MHDLATKIAESNIQLQAKLSGSNTKDLDARRLLIEREIAKSQAFLKLYGSGPGSGSETRDSKEEGERIKTEGLIDQLRLEIETLKQEEKDINALFKM